MAELAVGYISIVADASAVPGQIKKSLRGASGYGADVGNSIGSKISSGIGKTLKAGAIGVGAAAGGALAGSIAKGVGRLNSLDQASAKLEALGNSGQEVDGIMSNALASVKGTAFGIGEAAGTAATMVASGVEPGKELESVLTGVADSAAIAGVGMDDMGLIWGKVAAKGKLDGETMAQMLERQIPIYDILSEKTGIASEDIADMVSKGEIDFQTFSEAMNDYVGGGAKRMGETVQGSMDNVGAAMGRFGEALLAPAFSAAPALLSSFGGLFDKMTDAIAPVSEELGKVLTPALENFAGVIENRVAPFAGEAAAKIGDIVVSLTERALDPSTWETVGDIFSTIKDVVAEMWPSIESLAGSFLTITQNVSVATWQALASALDAIAPLVESVLVPLVEKVAEFAENNPGAVEKIVMAFLGFKGLKAVAGPVGTAASTLGTLGGAVKGVAGAFKGASIGKGLLNIMGMAKSANPILSKLGGVVGTVFKAFWKIGPILANVGKIFGTVIRFINPWVGAITLVVGALTWFFMKTELGQQIWETMTTAIAAGWTWLKDTLAATWEIIKTAVFDAWESSVTWLQETWETVTSAISGAWTWLKDTLVAAWEAIKEFVINAWNSYWSQVKSNFELVTGALNTAWTWIKDRFTAVWNTIKEFVVAAFEQAWTNLRNNFQAVIDALNNAWTWLKDMLLSVWYTIRDAVINAFQTALEGLRSFFQIIVDKISGIWNSFKNHLHTVWVWVRDNVFDAIGRGLDQVKGWFQSGVDGIGRIWDGLKDAAKRPVKFVIDTVWNNGLLKAINAVTSFINMDDIQPINIGFARGGILPGQSRMADGDNRLVPMRDGEGVLVSEGLRDSTSRGMFLAANEHAKRGGSFASFVNEMGSGFATGGILNLAGSLSGVQESHARFVAKHFPDLFALTSASRSEPGSFHDYGAQKATDWQAQDGQFATQMPTAASKKLARAIYMNFPNSAELIHWPLDGWQNLDEGRPYDFGAGTNAVHTNHVHWATHSPLQFDGDDIVLTDSGGGGSDGSFVKRIWDGIVDKINPYDDAGNGWFSEVPGAFVKSATSKLWDFVSEKVKSAFSSIGGGSGADQWSDLALVALKRMGYGEEHLSAMLQQIQIESGGNPSAVNMWDENAVRGTPSGGLLQVIEPTYRRVRNAYPDAFEGLPDDRMEPITNLTAGVGAVKMDWGGPAGRWPTRDGYAAGGIVVRDNGGLVPSGAAAVNMSGRDELMLPPSTTALFNKFLKDMPGVAGALERSAVAFQAATEELGLQEQARKSAEDYAAEQASGVLGTFGLEGLVPIAQKLGADAWEAYQASPYDVGVNGQTIVVEYVGDENDREWKMLQKLDKEVALLKAKRKPKASAMTRGGVQ